MQRTNVVCKVPCIDHCNVPHLKAYNGTAKEGWDGYVSEFVEADDYVAKVGGADHIRSLPLPAF